MTLNNVLVCLPVTDLPVPYVKSEKKVCHTCGVPVWVSWNSLAQGFTVFECHDCAAGEEVGVTQETLAESFAWLEKKS